MTHLKPSAALLAVILFALFAVTGCSEDENGVGPSDTTPPTVAGHYPVDGATNVSRSGPYWIAFSEPMNEALVE
ncbi:MAG TPA: Ig-like domain-containing protein, partial [Patescibacteria group bacterium]|nr:Ig-like domain-containing protein [Patescibacteria group bacterium]